jgi:hypothetical protein
VQPIVNVDADSADNYTDACERVGVLSYQTHKVAGEERHVRNGTRSFIKRYQTVVTIEIKEKFPPQWIEWLPAAIKLLVKEGDVSGLYAYQNTEESKTFAQYLNKVYKGQLLQALPALPGHEKP